MHPETPEQGLTLEELFAGRGMDIPQMLAHLKRTAAQLGLPFGTRTRTFNSRRAQELGKWAEDEGRGDAFHREAFQAYFAQGRNIAQDEVLKKMAAAVGLDGDRALAVLQEGRYKEAVDRDWQRARELGVNAVPTFQMHDQLLVGAQSVATLDRFVRGEVF